LTDTIHKQKSLEVKIKDVILDEKDEDKKDNFYNNYEERNKEKDYSENINNNEIKNEREKTIGKFVKDDRNKIESNINED